jgi:hypothetical protein
MMKGWIVPAFALLVCTSPGIAEEDFDPEPIIEGRQAALRDIGAAFKAISDELKAPTPMLTTIRSNSKQIEDLMKQQHFWFPPETRDLAASGRLQGGPGGVQRGNAEADPRCGRW